MDTTKVRKMLNTFAASSVIACVASISANSAYAVPAGAAMQFQENRAIQERAQQELRRPASIDDDRSAEDDIVDRPDAGDNNNRPDAGEVKSGDTGDHNVVKKQMPDGINK